VPRLDEDARLRELILELRQGLHAGDIESVLAAEEPGDELPAWARFEIRIVKAHAARKAGHPPAAEEQAHLALGIALREKAAERTVRAYEALAVIYWRPGRYLESLHFLERAIGSAQTARRKAGLRRQLAAGFLGLGKLEDGRRALESAAKSGAGSLEVELSKVFNDLRLRDVAAARARLREIGDCPVEYPSPERFNHDFASASVWIHDDPGRAEAALGELVEECRQGPPWRSHETYTRLALAEAKLAAHDEPGPCLNECERALELARIHGHTQVQADLHRLLAIAHRRAGDRDASNRAFERAQERSRTDDAVLVHFRVLADQVKALIDEAELDALPALESLLDRAEETARAIQHDSFTWEVRVLRALARAAFGRSGAVERLDRCRAMLWNAPCPGEVSSHLRDLWCGWLDAARATAEAAFHTDISGTAAVIDELVAALGLDDHRARLTSCCDTIRKHFAATGVVLLQTNCRTGESEVLANQGIEAATMRTLGARHLGSSVSDPNVPILLSPAAAPAEKPARSAMLYSIAREGIAEGLVYVEATATDSRAGFDRSDLRAFASIAAGVSAIVRVARGEQGADSHRREAAPATRLGAIRSRSAAMIDVLDRVRGLKAAELPILITGESGTGKELVAELIHQNSPRAGGPFVAVNCAAIPESMAEAELFGFKRGAFTGATEDRPGLFRAAHGGTLFLDEIAEMAPAMQAKLLRALAEREVRPVGCRNAQPTDVRIVAATNRDPREEMDAGRFRPDLYYRLAGTQIHLPALRERMEDLPELIDQFLATFQEERRLDNAPHFSAEALHVCQSYHWPGNIRELKNAVLTAAELHGRECASIPKRLLPDYLRQAASGPGATEGRSGLIDDLFDWITHTGHRQVIDEIQRRVVERALGDTGGNQRAAARVLRMQDSSLRRVVSRLGVQAHAG